MRLIVDQAPLHEALSLLRQVIPKKVVNPALDCVRIEAAADGTATLRAGNGDQWAEVGLDLAAAVDPGVAVVPLPKLQEMVACLDGDLALEADGRRCRVEAAGADCEVPVFDPAAYPDVPAVDTAAAYRLGPAAAVRLIDRVLFACDDTSARFALSGVKLEAVAGGTALRAIATDSRRMSVAVEPAAVDGSPYLPPGAGRPRRHRRRVPPRGGARLLPALLPAAARRGGHPALRHRDRHPETEVIPCPRPRPPPRPPPPRPASPAGSGTPTAPPGPTRCPPSSWP
jgi:hypothetical protein